MKITSNLMSMVVATKLKWALITGVFIIPLLSCDVEEVPEMDDVPPAFTLNIQGAGINRSFTQRDNFNEIQLNLLEGTTYDFTFLGADAGGVEQLILVAPWQSVDFSNLPSDVQQTEDGIITTLTKSGDIDNAVTALSFSGEIQIIGVFQESFTLNIEVHDFAIPANSTYASLQIKIVEDQDQVGL